ncbi:MAG: exo-alpha-sialidase [Acidobacteria bacterium]|nr:exo-alpha-sialidase [Acidobacteriota bacterium]
MKTLIAALVLAGALAMAEPKREFIYEKAPFPSCHASTIVETSPGEFLAAWFGGAGEGKPDVAVWGARRTASGWSEPFEMAREPNIAAYNPVLFFTKDRVLWLYYKFGPSPQTWTAARLSSRDRGKTWSGVDHLPAGLLGPIKNKPLVLPDGTVVSGTSTESYRSWACWVERSTDNGRTWSKHGPIIAPAPASPGAGGPATVPDSGAWRSTHGIIQPAIVPLKGGKLRMFVRATADIGYVSFADSADGGRTWTAARATSLPNPNSGIDAAGLRDGRVLLVYNHTNRGRSPINVAVSNDGDNWNSFLALETEAGEFSYPAVIQSSDGNIHITYTWKRVKIRHVEIPLAKIPK